MIANSRTCIAVSTLVVLATTTVGFWLGQTTTRPMTTSSPDERLPAAPAGSSELVASLQASQSEQARRAEELLAWCEQLRKSPKQVTIEDRKVVFQAISLFGDLRYALAVNFLVQESFSHEGNVGWINPNASGVWRELPPWKDIHPHLAALIQIGPPASAPLVDEYIRYWKIGREREKTGAVLPTLEYTLSEESLLGATLNHIEKRLLKANFAAIDRNELDALQHLKRELLKPFE